MTLSVRQAEQRDGSIKVLAICETCLWHTSRFATTADQNAKAIDMSTADYMRHSCNG